MTTDWKPLEASANWREERLRYNILRVVYDLAGARCDKVVTGSEIGSLLDLRYEDLFRIIHFLENHAYLTYLGPGPRVCITDRGIRYIEQLALRRRSLRNSDHPFTLARRR